MNCYFFFFFFKPHRPALCYLALLCMYRGWTGKSGVLSPWGCRESDTTERLNWTELKGSSQVVQMVKNTPAIAGDIKDAASIPGLGRSPGGGHGNPLQCSCLEKPLNRGVWQATVPWGHKESDNSSDLTHMHACTCMYRCIWEELWVYIVFMWSMYQSSTCAPSIVFQFLKFFWKNWAFRLEFVTCKFLFQQKWQWSNYTFSANRSPYLISPSLYIAVFLCFLLFCFPLCVCVIRSVSESCIKPGLHVEGMLHYRLTKDHLCLPKTNRNPHIFM